MGTKRTVDISGMDESRARYGYEWGCQVLMFRALHWLRSRKTEKQYPEFVQFKNITGLMPTNNDAAREMEKFALDHVKIKEFGATGAMVQYAMIHAMKRFELGDEGYLKEFADQPDRIFEFDVDDALPELAEVSK